MLRKFLSSTALAAFLIGGNLYAGNILANPGFETGSLGPWFTGRTQFCSGTCTDWFVTNSNPNSGTYSAEDVGNLELEQTFAGVSAADITSVTWFVQQPDGGGVEAVDFFYSDSTDAEFVVPVNGTGWQQENATADVAPAKTLVGFSVWGVGGLTSFVDDLDIEANTTTPEPETFALLGAGLLGLGLLRKKARK